MSWYRPSLTERLKQDTPRLRPKRVLVAGGAGFIGGHLTARLLERGDDVLVVDNCFTGSKENLSPWLSHPQFEYLRHDISHPLSVEVEDIYNLACPASPVHYQHNPTYTVKTSVLGSINLLELAQRLKAKSFFASTSEVYGDPQVHPQTESYFGHVNPIGPRSCYDEGKRCAETLYFCHHYQHGLPIRVVRIFNTYGPGMHPNDGRVVSNFIVQALLNRPITMQGNGDQTRSFCYVDDLVDGMIKFMDLENEFPGPINLGNPHELTIKELAELIIELTGSSSQISYRPMPENDPVRRRPDITLASNKLGWKPTVSLKTGLLHTIAYFERVLQANQLALCEGEGLHPVGV